MDSITCNVRALDVQFDDGSDDQIFACTINDNQGILGGLSYNIDLSEDFVDDNMDCISKGECYVDIPGGQVIDEEGAVPSIAIPAGASLAVFDKSESEPGAPQSRKLATTGINPVLVVRVRTNDSNSAPSRRALEGAIYGTGSGALTNSMKSQYEVCSNYQFSFSPVTGNSNVDDGVVEVSIDGDVDGTDIFSLTNKMYQAADSAVGTSLSSTPRHVIVSEI